MVRIRGHAPATFTLTRAYPRRRLSRRRPPTKAAPAPSASDPDDPELERLRQAELVAVRVPGDDRDRVLRSGVGRRVEPDRERGAAGLERAAVDAAGVGRAGDRRVERQVDLRRVVMRPDDSPALLVLLLDVVDLGSERAAARRGGRPGRELHGADVGAVGRVGGAGVDRPRVTALVGEQARRRLALVHHRAVDRRQLRVGGTAVVLQGAELRVGAEDVRAGRRLGGGGVPGVLDQAEREVEAAAIGRILVLEVVRRAVRVVVGDDGAGQRDGVDDVVPRPRARRRRLLRVVVAELSVDAAAVVVRVVGGDRRVVELDGVRLLLRAGVEVHTTTLPGLVAGDGRVLEVELPAHIAQGDAAAAAVVRVVGGDRAVRDLPVIPGSQVLEADAGPATGGVAGDGRVLDDVVAVGVLQRERAADGATGVTGAVAADHRAAGDGQVNRAVGAGGAGVVAVVLGGALEDAAALALRVVVVDLRPADRQLAEVVHPAPAVHREGAVVVVVAGVRVVVVDLAVRDRHRAAVGDPAARDPGARTEEAAVVAE